MLSIVIAALRSRRSSTVAVTPLRGFATAATAAIAALAVGFAAAAPGYVAASSDGHVSAGFLTIASATAVLVALFASAAIFRIGRLQIGRFPIVRIQRSVGRSAGVGLARIGQGLPAGYVGCVVGALGGLFIAGAAVAAGPTDLVPVTIGLGVASAAVAAAACIAGEYLGTSTGRRTATDGNAAADLSGATNRPRGRRWLVAAGALAAVAVAARHAGLLADLVPYVVAAAVGSAGAGVLRPVARWIGFRAVRVTESVPEEHLDITVDGHAIAVGAGTVRDDAARPNDVDNVPAVDRRSSGRFARGTIAAAGYLARRVDLDHVVALAVTGVVIAGAATFAWTSSVDARHDRAAIELGADRVLTVAPVSAAHLLSAVRAADPAGRYAMAAVVAPATTAGAAVVAVDSQRLATVVRAGVRSGPTGRQLAALLRPKQMPPTRVTGATLQLNVITSSTVGPATIVDVLLKAPDGVTRSVGFGPLRTGEHVYAAAAPCPGGCTVSGFTVSGTFAAAQPVVSVILRELRQRSPDRDVLDPSAFADASRWSLGLVGTSGAQTFAVSEAGLDIAIAHNATANEATPRGAQTASAAPSASAAASDATVVFLNAGVATSAVTGPETAAGQPYDRPPGFAGTLNVRRLDTPVPGVPAGGILADLSAVPPTANGTTQAMTAPAGTAATTEATSQVWLRAGAPPSLVDDLGRYGLRVVAATSIDARAASYADQPAVALARFQLIAGIMLLVCVALLIGSVSRAHRGTRTAARAVGLSAVVWAIGVGGALIARHAGPDFGTRFVDGWARVPPPPLIGSGPFAVFALASGLVLAAAVGVVVTRRRPAGVVNLPGSTRPPDDRLHVGSPAFTDGPRTVSR